MIVIDARLPIQPAVPVVSSLPPSATATQTDHTDDPRLRWKSRRIARARGGLTAADLALIHAVTGEDAARLLESELSTFAAHILADRRRGTLPPSTEITADYLLRSGRRLCGLGDANPFAGASLRRALLFLETRTTGRVDTVL